MTDKKDSNCVCGCLPKVKKDAVTSRPGVKESEKPKSKQISKLFVSDRGW